jgi:hypothetical protein
VIGEALSTGVLASLEQLPSGSLRVRVYAGIDPVSKKKHYLVGTVPAGPTAAREAEKVRTRFLNEVDERRNPRTKATLNQLLDRWLEVAELEQTTRSGYVRKLDKHVRPVLGGVQVGRLDAETLQSFYAMLRRCREHCDGRQRSKHRVHGPHGCDAGCVVHVCRPLAPATVRQVHAILAAALVRAVRWRWIAINPPRPRPLRRCRSPIRGHRRLRRRPGSSWRRGRTRTGGCWSGWR